MRDKEEMPTTEHELYISVGMYYPVKPSVFKKYIDDLLSENSRVQSWGVHEKDEYIDIISQQAEEITERDRTIAKIQREFEQTEWGKENIELRERFNYWRELAGTRDNKIRDQAEEIERLKQENDVYKAAYEQIRPKVDKIFESLFGGESTC